MFLIPQTDKSGQLYGARGFKVSKPAGTIFQSPIDGRFEREAKRKRANKSYAETIESAESAVVHPLVLNPRHLVGKNSSSTTLWSTKFVVPEIRDAEGQVLLVSQPSQVILGARVVAKVPPRPLFDPLADQAIVLFDPTLVPLQAKESVVESIVPKAKTLADILGKREAPSKADVKVPVVVDPRIGKVLRPHQIEGVKFLYNCCTGATVKDQFGCIMADEMGLGKTLQCIALMWTLLKQSPQPGKSSIDKCVIACPSSLVRNWANELVKWLGKGSIHPLVMESKWPKEEAHRKPVMIVSYETLRNLVEVLKDTEIGLLLCDEGHRLKNTDSLTYEALNSLRCLRRVILTGTPVQNDLSEYYALLTFANPDYLGTRQEFRKSFELAILRGRDSEATEKEIAASEEKKAQLLALVNPFIIRRTNDLLSKYLPVKYEHVVFCRLAPFQLELYRHFLRSPDIRALLRGSKTSQALTEIGILQKLCNHPDLLNLDRDIPGAERCLPVDYDGKQKRYVNPEFSGKMRVLERMLRRINEETNDKIVLISNFTSTLDLFERLCRNRRYGCLRLDGTMNITKRQLLVDRFNDPLGKEFVFLLSSKAGGCGLNLIGANRLVLFDPDWNPATDQQALARVWRDGQKKECFIYRFFTTGTIEEKIFQRQSHKQSLSSCVVDNEDAERHFSSDLLRQLFQLHENTSCQTHDTFKCSRCSGGLQKHKAPAMLYGDTSTWNHFEHDALPNVHDDMLRAESVETDVSFAFQYCSI